MCSSWCLGFLPRQAVSSRDIEDVATHPLVPEKHDCTLNIFHANSKDSYFNTSYEIGLSDMVPNPIGDCLILVQVMVC